MPYQLNDEQFKAVLALDSAQRFSHFLARIADWEQLWAAKNSEGWLVPLAPEDFEYFPVWPHPKYAQYACDSHCPGHEATEITIEELLDEWLPMLETEKIKLAVFPNAEWAFWCIEAADFKRELLAELSKYE